MLTLSPTVIAADDRRGRRSLNNAATINNYRLLYSLIRRLKLQLRVTIDSLLKPFHRIIIRQVKLILHIGFNAQILKYSLQGILDRFTKMIIQMIANPMMTDIIGNSIQVNSGLIKV